jgi:pimeloyl-ACP methyl ester carboxylesterase
VDESPLISLPFPVPFAEWVTSAEFYWSTLAKRPSIRLGTTSQARARAPINSCEMGTGSFTIDTMMALSQCAGRFFATYRASKLTHLLLFTLAATTAVARAEHRLVNIGDRRLSIDCDGDRSHRETVVLIAGLGRTAQDWAKVQPAVYGFARVCSYDRAGSGESDKVDPPQSIEQTVEDLHKLLNAAGEKAPYILVGHSIAGVYCRRYATRFPRDVAGFLFLDSSHEEQMWRLHEVDPKAPRQAEVVTISSLRRAGGSIGIRMRP